MSKIKVLDRLVQNQIAAGEVIERPASVLKELIENSIDSKATEIIIELTNSGKDELIVFDNGEGMDEEDLKQCILRHATSKISKLEDLNNIESFGFRGEALSSIASVSRLTIKSQCQGNTAKKIVAMNDKIESLESTDSLNGTEVRVESLFFNVPARRKYLKSDSTELRECLKVVQKEALINSDIRFILRNNRKDILNLPKIDSWLDRIKQVFNENEVRNLVAVSYQCSDFSIKGFISKPEGMSSNSNQQYLYVNKRAVVNPVFIRALKDGYKELFIRGLNPVYVIDIQINSERVDVNIHPQKKEIKFLDSSEIYQGVVKAISNALFHKVSGANDSDNYIQLKHNESSGSFQNRKFFDNFGDSFANSADNHDEKSFDNFQKPIKVINQVNNSYIICETSDELWVVDQHAAHERVLYETLKNSWKSKNYSTQKIAFPLTINLRKEQMIIFQENQHLLSDLGFKIDIFDEDTIIIEEVPQLLKADYHLKETILGIINDFNDWTNKKLNLVDLIDSKLKTIACRSAIKFKDAISKEEMEKLVSDLEELKIPYCPHGRPAVVKLTWDDLNKLFKRII